MEEQSLYGYLVFTTAFSGRPISERIPCKI